MKTPTGQTFIRIESLSVNTDVTFEPTGFELAVNGTEYNVSSFPLTIDDLYPETEYTLKVTANGKDGFLGSKDIKRATKSWNCKVSSTGEAPTSVTAFATFVEDDARPDKVWWELGDAEIPGKAVTFVSLVPNNSQSLLFYIQYRDRKYSYSLDSRTTELQLTTLKPKCVSVTCAIVAAETNISDMEPNAGFEWRKHDAPASLPSTEGYAVVCEGMLEGYIKNLQSSSYYDVRPFYKDFKGKYYYGEWITFDPSDFSYFEPTIRTYPVQNITENSATVRGYVLQGTDNITRQGFQYWQTGGNKVKGNAPSAAEIITVEATGQVMTVTLDDLEAGTDYTFRVFAETEAGTTYGEEQQFTTEGVAGVYDIDAEMTVPKVTGYYNMTGVWSSKPYKGLNIVVYSDGTSKKMMKQ